MTVRELLETNVFILDVEITVRTADGWLLDQLNIGLEKGFKPPCPTRVPREEKYRGCFDQSNEERFRDAEYILESINAKDDGKDYFEVKLNRFPKGWLDLVVRDWVTYPASSLEHQFMTKRSRSDYDNCVKVYITANEADVDLTIPKRLQGREQPNETDDDGQISLDWGVESVGI